MKYTIKIIFGKETINQFISNISLTNEENETYLKEYSFETGNEMHAFKKGLSEAIGWMECHIIEQNVSKKSLNIS